MTEMCKQMTEVGWLVGRLIVFFYGVSSLLGSYNAELNFKKFSLVSSSCHAARTDITDPLSPLLPIIHRL